MSLHNGKFSYIFDYWLEGAPKIWTMLLIFLSRIIRSEMILSQVQVLRIKIKVVF